MMLKELHQLGVYLKNIPLNTNTTFGKGGAKNINFYLKNYNLKIYNLNNFKNNYLNSNTN
jgi:hypothetical protein